MTIKKIILSLSIVFLSFIIVVSSSMGSPSNFSGITSKEGEYPILVLDQPIPATMGAIFKIMVTTFSTGETVTLSVTIGNQTLFNETRVYFVNFEVIINATSLNLAGDYTIIILSVDGLLRKNSLQFETYIDPVKPIFEQVLYYQEMVNYNELFNLQWTVKDDNFARMEIFIQGSLSKTVYSKIGSTDITADSWYLPDGYTQYENLVRLRAYDTAGNFVDYFFTVIYIDNRYDQEDQQDRREFIFTLIKHICISIGVLLVVSGFITWQFNERGKDREDMARPKIIRKTTVYRKVANPKIEELPKVSINFKEFFGRIFRHKKKGG